MRPPGDNFALAAGFLVGEGVLSSVEDLRTITYCAGATQDGRNTYNVVDVRTAAGVSVSGSHCNGTSTRRPRAACAARQVSMPYGPPRAGSCPTIPPSPCPRNCSRPCRTGCGRGRRPAGTGVTVNSVIAGPTRTGGVEDFVYGLVDRSLPREQAQRVFMREYRPQSLLQRLIEPEEIAHMVVYLSSPQASATTGGALRVDGGYVDAILP